MLFSILIGVSSKIYLRRNIDVEFFEFCSMVILLIKVDKSFNLFYNNSYKIIGYKKKPLGAFLLV